MKKMLPEVQITYNHMLVVVETFFSPTFGHKSVRFLISKLGVAAGVN